MFFFLKLTGITEKLWYLRDIRVQAVILSSFYESTPEPGPNSKPDYGYEVTNHTVIDTVYGNMNDFVELLDAAHELGW